MLHFGHHSFVENYILFKFYIFLCFLTYFAFVFSFILKSTYYIRQRDGFKTRPFDGSDMLILVVLKKWTITFILFSSLGG